MTVSAADRTAVTELISQHGHLVDAGELDRLHEVFTTDATFDLVDFGLGSVKGLAALRELARTLDTPSPVGHHVTNIVLTPVADNRIDARSKGIAINADGSTASVVYEDSISRGDLGWRINNRKVTLRRSSR